MGDVKAGYLEAEKTVVSDGADTGVPFFGTETKVNVGAFVRASLNVVVSAAGASITVNGYKTANATADVLYAKTALSAGNNIVLSAFNVEPYVYIEVLEHAVTATQSQTCYLSAK